MDDRPVTLEDLAGDPHPHLARLRAASPVCHVAALGGHLVTGRAAALAVLGDAATFTVDHPAFTTARVVGPSMLSLDGASHRRHRAAFAPRFHPRRIEASFGAFVSERAELLVGALAPDGADLRAELAAPLAASVVAHTLGLDGRDAAVVAELLGWYRDIVASVAAMGAGEPPTAAGTLAMTDLAAAVSGQAIAGADDRLDAAEWTSNAAVVMFGGIETTEGMISSLLWHVLGDRAVAAEITEHPALVRPAVEESLRLEPAAAVVDRYATRDVELGGSAIGAGGLVVVSLAGANRDPAEFDDPDRFDLGRPNARRHLAFAAGPHACIGMELARLEARTALATLLARRPGARLAAGAPPPAGLVFRKPASLPVEW